MSEETIERALAVFERIAEAEARVHGVPVETIHFHEIGALDSIVDVVAAAQAIEDLGIDRLTASPIPIGGGTVRMEHGLLPVPAPATAMLLEGWPILSVPDSGEFITPTGAALLAVLAHPEAQLPSMRVRRVGWGAGTKEHPRLPNLVRLWLGEPAPSVTESRPLSVRTVSVLETQLDDCDPRWLALETEQLRREGALDVFLDPAQMKKGRLGTRVTVIAAVESADRLARILLERTPSLGVRIREERRWEVERREGWVETPLGRVRVKWVRRPDGWIPRVEADEVARLSAARGESASDIAEMLLRALGPARTDPWIQEG
jgi:uncharacterized protein (TIGR00299 family) protein